MSAELLGLKLAFKKLDKLKDYPKEQRQLIQVGGRAALRPAVNAMKGVVRSSNKKPFTKNGLSRRSGDLRRSIGTKSARTTPTVIAGPRSNKRFIGFYGVMVDGGTIERVTKKGYRRGRIVGKDLMMRAAFWTKDIVMRIYTEKVNASFLKYAKKAGLR